ncbi:hypothetical protein PTT_08215 [Pyrenophora teres f. teres 0-1]|uniref:Uncharacterized protein n=1 Tax=Pyrenophora teres f. teres (strain 0-1) TaxID=861557 RepID=E3RJB1_PYRTT|nr:hypothetical protein PTT_08215 [Pyrenophora teres f. teres 0-1]
MSDSIGSDTISELELTRTGERVGRDAVPFREDAIHESMSRTTTIDQGWGGEAELDWGTVL